MSRSNGEGRSEFEKGQSIITPYETKKKRRLRREAEEREWAARSGPVEVRRKDEK
jgi:hypothetical protein